MSMLQKLEDQRVLIVHTTDTELNISEACDGYYNLDLTKSETIQLAEELLTLAANMKG